MELLDLQLRDFRNIASAEISPSRHLTVLLGQNGQGKTNLLEGVYFLCTLKPLRATRLSELVRFGTPAARVTGTFLLNGAKREISVTVQEGQRQLSVDGKKAQSLEEYFGGVSVVAFTPDDLRVVKGGPEARRQFLDRAVFNRFPAYLRESRVYLRALKARNRLLKQGADAAYLEAYDEALAKAGARIWTRRRIFLHELAPRFEVAFSAIGRTEGQATLGYQPSGVEIDFAEAGEDALFSALWAALRARDERDRDRGFTSVGPHADDLSLKLGDKPAKLYASQGQQRALVIAWKIAEIENLQAALGYLPLLLLDDVSSELDSERNGFLMRSLAERGAQVVLTTTEGSLVAPAAGADARWYAVQRGMFEKRETATR